MPFYTNNTVAPRIELEPDTVIYDMVEDRHVVILPGHVILPTGSKVELTDLELGACYADATVQRVRLVGGHPGAAATIYLDCIVPKSWWDAHPIDA